MLRPIIDDASERLLMCCPSCFYSEEAQQENRQVFSKEFSRESNNLCETLDTNITLDPTLKRCWINCNYCMMKTIAVEIHSRSNEKMNVERLLMCCPSCFYSEEAQQENRQVFSKEFSRESNNLCETLDTNITLDPTLKRCWINCNYCMMKTIAVEIHSRSNEKMNV
ncbi:hypothetical protein Glove_465g35 [Diversispora epigaea]|uniref:Uncharacterized protein n=1 Tax=Diversispora epigaea TaxID=1348612 RepID=A0A397GNJ9_9GLOM|nr:hypothetical protein Glove_465g35 [Diversispora epigaea]